jgi:hypothetical protein
VERLHERSELDFGPRRKRKDGPILANATNQILQPTAFSAVK